MSLSKLAAQCQVCPFSDECDHKRMEEVGFLPLPSQQGIIPVEAMPNEQLFLAEPVINGDELVEQIAKAAQIPEKLLRGPF